MPPLTHALILTAGLGTRLHPLTTVRAKPAVPVAGVPLIRRIIPWLAASGVTDTVLNLHHLPQTIAAVAGDGDEFGVRVRYSWEQPAVLGSAGGPRQALDIIGTDTFLIVNGDTLTDLDVGALVDSHRRHDALVTMAVIPNPNPRHYGGLRVDDDGVVLGVVPRGGGLSYHFIGVQVVHRDAFTGVPPSRFANSVGEVYDQLIAERRGRVRVHHCDARFWDIGTVADYWATSLEFARSEHRPLVQPATQVHETARVDQCITWDDVHIAAECRLSRCIITDGVRVKRDSVHHDAILLRGDSGETIAHPFEADRHD